MPTHTHTHLYICDITLLYRLQVRVYDEATKTLQATLTGGIGYQRVGHSNRIFSLKYCNEDENMLLSAGWDNTVQVLGCICIYAYTYMYVWVV